MLDTLPQMTSALPEIITAGMICFTLLAYLFFGERLPAIAYILVQLTLVVDIVLLLYQSKIGVYAFHGMIVSDQLGQLLKLFICLISLFVFLYSYHYVKYKDMPEGEYYVLALSSVLGMMILVSASNFITLFMGLELFSLPVYTLVALQRHSEKRTEAAMKYFVIGALGSGMLLYGLSMLYGATGTLDMAQAAQVIAKTGEAKSLVLVFGLVFVMAGVAFKLGAVPFHMWIPDVYDGAPTSVTLFVSTAPKIAALGMALRLLVDTMPHLSEHWQKILIVLAIASMGLGNLTAIAQSNIKRMLAYSSIAHIGYTLLGLIAATPNGYASALFYILTYSVMTAGAFGLLAVLSYKETEVEKISDLSGLSQRNPWVAFLMLLVMFAMAGIPPLVGFMAKLAVLEALIRVNLVWLAALALVFAIIGAYYYIRVVKVMYFEQPGHVKPVLLPNGVKMALSINCLAVLALGIYPGALFHLCQSAIHVSS